MACLVLALSGCSAHLARSTAENSPEPTYSTQIRPSDFAQIRSLLAARAKAVLAGDELAFMAAVDRQNSDFYQSQQVMFDNLQDLPVTSMSYDVGNSGLTNAPGIEGGPLLSPEIVEHVYFAGTDRRPVGNEISETFVKRDGRWLLASDSSDSSQVQNVTARPWAGPRISVATRGPLIVVTDASLPGGATHLADVVQSDIQFDAGVLQVPVNDKLLVDATAEGSVGRFDNEERVGAVTYAAAAMRDFRATGIAGLRVKVNPQIIRYLSFQPELLRHELTHFLMFGYTADNPKWLTEGLAEYVGHYPQGLPSEQMTPGQYVRLMHRPRELTVSGLFGQDPDTDYPLAMACVTYLVQHGGIGRLKTLMAAYAAYQDQPFEDEHTAQVLKKVYGMTPSQVAHGAFTLLADLR